MGFNSGFKGLKIRGYKLLFEPVPMAERSKASVCGLSSLEIVGSNPTGDLDVCLLWVLCAVRWRSLRRADHSSRGVLPTVVRRCVWYRSLVNEEALPHWGLSYKKKLLFEVYKRQTGSNGSVFRSINFSVYASIVIDIGWVVCERNMRRDGQTEGRP